MHAKSLVLFLAFCGSLLGLVGCHSAGPTHLYLCSKQAPKSVIDLEAQGERRTQIQGRIDEGQVVVGLAYDFNTDFIALRLEPAGIIRIFKRGENRFKRDITLPSALRLQKADSSQVVTNADLALRPEDRHLFAVNPRRPEIAEFTLFGDFVRTISLQGCASPLAGLSYDHRDKRLLGLVQGSPGKLMAIDAQGRCTDLFHVSDEVNPISLGCDADAKEIYLPLNNGEVGAYSFEGKLLRRIPTAKTPPTALDAGPRSYVRLF